MTVDIKASCHVCGDFNLPAEKILVKLFPQVPTTNYITFTCPICNAPCERRGLESATLMALVSAGSPKLVTYFAAEILEPHFEGAPLTQDDILDFMLDTQQEDFLADSC